MQDRYRWYFGAVWMVHLLALLVHTQPLVALTKPLLLPLLLLGYWRAVEGRVSRWIVAALLLSWAGDVLLMWQAQSEGLFLAGLAAFLLAHLSYIAYFRSVDRGRPRWLIIVGVLGYATAMYALLWPRLGDLALPVALYTLIITLMLLAAIHAFPRWTVAAAYCVIGATSFVLSDSVLALNKFYQPFTLASFVIMLTYGAAQWALVEGIIHRSATTAGTPRESAVG